MILSIFKSFVEVLTLSSFFYWLSVWLARDTQKNLLWYFYGYCLFFLLSYGLNITVIATSLLYISPLLFILMIIIHQDILQKNFVSFQKKLPAQAPSQEWVEELARSALYALNKNKTFLCIIEHTMDIKPFLKLEYAFATPLNTNLLNFLLESSLFDENRAIVCDTQGKLLGVNGAWKIHQAHSADHKNDALLITGKLDAIVIKGNPQTRTFDLTSGGIIQEKLSSHHLIHTIKMRIGGTTSIPGDTYEYHTKTSVNHQQNP